MADETRPTVPPTGSGSAFPVKPKAPDVVVAERKAGVAPMPPLTPTVPTIDPTQIAVAMLAAQQAMHARATGQNPTPDLDKTVPGGRYMVDGKLVNAHGHEIKEDDEPDVDKDKEKV